MISLTMTQETDGNFLRIKSVKNSVEVAIGQVLSRAIVRDWLCKPYVQVAIVGMTAQEGELQP